MDLLKDYRMNFLSFVTGIVFLRNILNPVAWKNSGLRRRGFYVIKSVS